MKIPFGEGFCNSYDHKSVPLGVKSLFSLGLVSERKAFDAVFAHSDFLFPFTKGFMPNGQGVCIVGQILDLKLPGFVGHREKGMLHYENVRAHPAVKITVQFDRSLALFEYFLSIWGAGGLANVEGPVFSDYFGPETSDRPSLRNWLQTSPKP